jgi:hypothetical protein
MVRGFHGFGPDIDIRNCVLIGNLIEDQGGMTIFGDNSGGGSDGMYGDYQIEDIDVYVTTGSRDLFERTNLGESVFKNIYVRDLDDSSTGSIATAFRFGAGNGSNPAWLNDQGVVVDNVVIESRADRIVRASIDNASTGATYFFVNSSFQDHGTLIVDPTGSGKVDGLDGTLDGVISADTSLLRFYFKDTEIDFGGGYGNSHQVTVTLGRFEGVVDLNDDDLSENSGAVNLTASGGETYVDVDPDLWYVPLDESFVTYTGADADLIASVAPECPNGLDEFGYGESGNDYRHDCSLRFTFAAPLSAGQAVTFDWTAAIHPWEPGVMAPDFSTDGL